MIFEKRANGIKLILIAVIIFTTNNLFSQITKKVLFLGNSYTAVNNLPQLIADVASSTGDSLIFDSNTPGGYTLEGHSSNATSIDKIAQGNWDFVVLQEQSQRPSLPDVQVEQDVYPYAHILDSLINTYNLCAETMFYMTWGRKNGDASNCGWWPPVCSYSGMDSLLSLRYKIMADTNYAVVSPVGTVWKQIREEYPDIELYMSDESHPSAAGSYAAACCFYSSIFRKNPLLINYDYSLPENDAASIRDVVKDVVFDSLSNWFIGEYDPKAEFAFEVFENNSVVFSNMSDNATDYFWDFGDGSYSFEDNPVHNYILAGEYETSLIADNCANPDTIFHTVNTLVSAQADNINLDGFYVYPNPFTTQLTVHIDNFKQLSLTNSYGKVCIPSYSKNGTKFTLDLSSFSSGIYQLKVLRNNKFISRKIVKL